MTNQQLKAHCEDVIANPQDHLDWVVDMARVALASLEAVPVAWVTMQQEFCDGERMAITNKISAEIYNRNCYDLTALYTALPAAELNPIELLDCDYGAVSHTSGGSDDYCKGFVDGAQYAAHKAREAGYEVKV